ncbi:unnamed protein product [Gordionus sp. m RMFG-2023]
MPPKNIDVNLRNSLNLVSANNVMPRCNNNIFIFFSPLDWFNMTDLDKEKLLAKIAMNNEVNTYVPKEEMLSIKEKVNDIDMAIINSSASVQDLEKINENDIDWLLIAKEIGNKNDRQCQHLWNLYLKPSICKKEWNSEENEKLKMLVSEYGLQDWKTISEELGTSRMPYQCLGQYQKHFKKGLDSWTKEEDQKLMDLVGEFKIGNCILWNNVFQYFSNKNYVQMVRRYRKFLNPQNKVGKWNKSEDKQLLTCISKHKHNCWSRISRGISSRTDIQCRDRYQNFLNPILKFGSWGCFEDAKILKYVKSNGCAKWVKLASMLPGRSDNQVLSRCGVLLKSKCNMYSKEILEERMSLLEMELDPLYQKYLKNIKFEGTVNTEWLLRSPPLTEKPNDKFDEGYQAIQSVVYKIVNRHNGIKLNGSFYDHDINKYLLPHSYLPPYKENMIAWANLQYLKVSLWANSRRLKYPISVPEEEVTEPETKIINVRDESPMHLEKPKDLNLSSIDIKGIPLTSGSTMIKAVYKIKIKRHLDPSIQANISRSPLRNEEQDGRLPLMPPLNTPLVLPQAMVSYNSFLPTTSGNYFEAFSLKEPIQISAALKGVDRQLSLSSTNKSTPHHTSDNQKKNAHQPKVNCPLQIAKQTKEYSDLKSYLRSILLYPAILTQASANKD